MAVWILTAVVFIFIRLYASNSIGRPICTTYISSSTVLLILIVLLTLDLAGCAEGLAIPRRQGIEASVLPALTLLAVNALASAIDVFVTRRGCGRLRELCLCVGQTPVWRPKAEGDAW